MRKLVWLAAALCVAMVARAHAEDPQHWIDRTHAWMATVDLMKAISGTAGDAVLAGDCKLRPERWVNIIVFAAKHQNEQTALTDPSLFDGGVPEATTTVFALLQQAMYAGHHDYEVYGEIACSKLKASPELDRLDKIARDNGMP